MKKNAYIIGGSGLIGNSLALELTNNYNVIVLDKKKINNKGISFIPFDCSKLGNIEKNLKKIFINNGIPDVMVNCSYPVTSDWIDNSFDKVKYNSFKKNIEMHLNSYCWISKIFADYMKKNKKSGSIVLLSSIYGVVGQSFNNYKNTNMKFNMTYPIIKSGIVGFIKQSASYYGGNNIRINSLAPGAIKGHVKGTNEIQNKNFIKNFSSRVPLKRLAKVDEIVKAIEFLLSERASYISGQNILVDGGYTAV